MHQSLRLPTRNRQLALSTLLIVAYLLLSICWQDLSFYDESYYMDSGLHVNASWFVHRLSDDPLYALWYSGLAVLIHNAVARYFFSWVTIVLVLGTLPAILRVRFAWLYTLVLVVLPVFSQVSVSLFAAIFVVAALSWLLQHSQTLTDASALACLCCFVVAFVRPEYAYGVLVAAVAILICCLVERRSDNAAQLWRALGGALLLFCAIAIVIRKSDSARSGGAFAQHYNLRASQSGVPFNTSTELSLYAYRVFHVPYNKSPGATVVDFFRANPRLFLIHISRNASDPFFLLTYAFILSGVLMTVLHRECVPWRGAALFVLLVALPATASSLIIYPRHHYAVIVLPAALLLNLNVFGGKGLFDEDIPVSPGLLPVVLVALLAYPAYKCLRVHHFPRPRTALSDIRCLRSLESSSPGRNNMMFDPSGIPNVYLQRSRNKISFGELENWAGFSEWVAQQHPGWVLSTPLVANQYGVSQSKIRDYLLEQGYVEHICSMPSSMTVYTSENVAPN